MACYYKCSGSRLPQWSGCVILLFSLSAFAELATATDKSANVTIVHGFTEGVSIIAKIAFTLLGLEESPANVEEILLDKYADMTGAEIFKIGERLRTQNSISIVVGPSSSAGVFLLHPHMVLMNVLHLSPLAEDPIFEAIDRFPKLLRMSKAYQNQLKAIVELLLKMKWNALAVISSENDYSRHASEYLRWYGAKVGVEISLIRRLNDLTGETNFREHLNDIRRSGNRVILLLCDHVLAGQLLKEADQLNMTKAGWGWIVWNDVADELIARNLSNVLESRTIPGGYGSLAFPDIPGLLAIRTSFTAGPLYDRFVSEFKRQPGKNDSLSPTIHQLKYADSIVAAFHGISQCRENVSGASLFECVLSLNDRPGITGNITFDPQKQEAVYDAQYEILNSRPDGRWWSTGMWKAGNSSTNSSLELNRDQLLLPGGVRTIPSYLTQLEYQVLEIVTITSEPFVNIKPRGSSNKLASGNIVGDDGKVYSGFCIELLEELKKKLSFQYNIRDLGPEAKFGSRSPVSGYWNGLIGEMLYGSVDLIVAPLTITEERLKYIDLTSSFMESELKFAINRHAVIGDDSAYFKFSFLLPFSAGLWVALLISIIVMGLYLTLISRLSPYGAHGRYYQSAEGAESCAKLAKRRKSSAHLMAMQRRKSSFALLPSGKNKTGPMTSDDEDPERTTKAADPNPGGKTVKGIMKKSSEFKAFNIDQTSSQLPDNWNGSGDSDSDEEGRNARRFMSINNALYFACAGLLWQSPECVPRAPAARVVAGIWYMVGVIIVASYTANLVAFVTHQSTTNHLNSLESLLNQRLISPGTVSSSSVENLLMTSNLDMAGKLYKEIIRHPETSLQPTFSSAWDLTMKGELAFVWDGAYLDYASLQDNCKTSTTPVGFGKPSYGFALPKGSPFTDIFNRQLLELRQYGFIEELTEKYFGKTCDSVRSDDADEENSQDRLTFSSLSGVFIMIGGGAAVSLLVLIIEWAVACFNEADNFEWGERSGFLHVLKLKFQRLSQDAKDNWVPFKRITKRWSTPSATADEKE